MNRIIALVLFVVSLGFAAWDGVSVKEPKLIEDVIEGDGYSWTYKNYQVSTPEELAWIAKEVNAGNDFDDVPFLVENDIVFGTDTSTVSPYKWIPIGKTDKTPFKGMFLGEGHTIYGLNLNSTDEPLTGLFGYVNEGDVENLTVANFNLEIEVNSPESVSGYYAGAVVAYSYKSWTKNLQSRGGNFSIRDKQEKADSRTFYLGGVVGYNKSGYADSCSSINDIVVSAYSSLYLGGVVGLLNNLNYNDIVSLNYASFDGKIDFTDSYEDNSIDVSNYNDHYVGGIVGASFISNGRVKNSINYGSVTANRSFVGGIAGEANVVDCVNRGDVSGVDGYAGGLTSGKAVQNSTNYGSVSGKYAGGISFSGATTSCTNYGKVNGSVSAAGISVYCDDVKYNLNRGSVIGDTAAGICVYVRKILSTSLSISNEIKGNTVSAGIAVVNGKYVYNTYYDSTLVKNVKSIWSKVDTAVTEKVGGIPSKQMQSAAFVNDLNLEIERETNLCPNGLNCGGRRYFQWGFDGQYPVVGGDSVQFLWHIYRDDGAMLELTFADAKGHVMDLTPAYSTQGHYFTGWVDSLGNKVTESTVFKDHGVIYATYSDAIVDESLIVYKDASEQPVEPWDGSEKMPDFKVRKDSNVYHVINTPAELAWFINHQNVYEPSYAILGRNIVLGKDTSSLMKFSFLKRDLETGISFENTYRGGVLDGDGHTIYGLTQPLFNEIGRDNSIVRNVNFANFSLQDSSGVVARVNFGTIENCTAHGSIDVSNVKRAGVFAGENLHVIKGCQNYADINVVAPENAEVNFAGIVPLNEGRVYQCVNHGNISIQGNSTNTIKLAGISVKNHKNMYPEVNDDAYVQKSVNKGMLSVNASNVYVGGISVVCDVGYQCLGISKNEGDISVSAGGGSVNVGGIIADGYYYSYLENVMLDSALNKGNIDVVIKDQGSELFVGGISAKHANVKNSRNEGYISIKDSSLILDNTRYMVAGGIVGWGGEIDSCENIGNVSYVASAIEAKDLKTDENTEYVSAWKYKKFSGGGANKSYFGGVGGSNALIQNSVNEGSVEGMFHVGGVSGYSNNFKNVINRAPVSAVGAGHIQSVVGGIGGICDTLNGAFNRGPVTFNSVSGDTAASYVGGVCGYGLGYIRSRTSNIASVTNNGVGEKNFTGGLFGYMSGSLYDAYNIGPIKAANFAGGVWGRSSILIASNVYNAAKIDAPQASSVGGTSYFDDESRYVMKFDTAATVYVDTNLFVDSVYRLILCSSSYNPDRVDIVPMATSGMKSDAFLATLNTTGGTSENSGLWARDDGYPYLIGEDGTGKPSANSSSSSESLASSSSEKIKSSSSSEGIESSSSSKKEESSSSGAELALPKKIASADFAVAINGRNVFLTKAERLSSYTLLDMHGVMITRGVVTTATTQIQVSHPGVYILRVGKNSKRVVVKD